MKNTNDFIYPNINKKEVNNEVEFETIIRIKREGKWYDKNIKERYEIINKSEITLFKNLFIEILIIDKNYWIPTKTDSPSENQENTTDDLTRKREHFKPPTLLKDVFDETLKMPFDENGNRQKN